MPYQVWKINIHSKCVYYAIRQWNILKWFLAPSMGLMLQLNPFVIKNKCLVLLFIHPLVRVVCQKISPCERCESEKPDLRDVFDCKGSLKIYGMV